MADLVRVRLNGTETNVGRVFADAKELKILDEPTHTPDGRPRRAVLTPQKKAAVTRAAHETTGDDVSTAKKAAPSAPKAKEAS